MRIEPAWVWVRQQGTNTIRVVFADSDHDGSEALARASAEHWRDKRGGKVVREIDCEVPTPANPPGPHMVKRARRRLHGPWYRRLWRWMTANPWRK